MFQRGMTRRDVLAAAVAAAAVAAVPALGQKKTEFVAGRLTPFPMTQVRLLKGEVQTQAEINDRYLDSLTVDRLLHSFRLTSGIASTATPYGGWEKPDCELRGHFNGGHYLSAVALAMRARATTRCAQAATRWWRSWRSARRPMAMAI